MQQLMMLLVMTIIFIRVSVISLHRLLHMFFRHAPNLVKLLNAFSMYCYGQHIQNQQI